jgi:predicted DCC family thiol-disulfide oxidoreductase YuxK
MEQTKSRTRILYNGRCHHCSARISDYARYAAASNLPLWFEDVHEVDLSDWGVAHDQAAHLLHVKHKGQTYIGFAAYLTLWNQLPRYRRMSQILGLPGVRQVLTIAQDRTLSGCLMSCAVKHMASMVGRPAVKS